MTKIFYYKIFIGFLFCCFSIQAIAQTDAPAPKKHKFTFYAGIGPNFYFNNLVVGKQKVNELNYSVVGRIMWEPENNLSLGIESGYYRLYTLESDIVVNSVPRGSLRIVNASIPLQLVVSMKFFENFYSSFSFGRAILLNKVASSDYGEYNANSLSLGDYTLSFGYKRLLNDKIFLGSEIKLYYSGKLEDRNIALVFMGGYRF